MTRRILDLGGDDWRLGQAPANASPESAAWDELERVAEWLPATVPGDVRADLQRAGRLADLSFGCQARQAQWVDDHCWWLVRDLDLAAAPDEQIHLVLRGVDYISDLFLNGQPLGRHEGMFSPQVYDVTTRLGPTNRLAVRLLGSRWLPQDRSSAWEKRLNRIEARFLGLPDGFPHRRDTLKCQMGCGWDFAPVLRSLGLWDDVYLVVSSGVFVRDAVARSLFTGQEVRLAIAVELEVPRACSVRIEASLAPDTFDGEPLSYGQGVSLAPGANRVIFKLAVPEPRLWWPWDHGHPDLYHLAITIWDGDQPLDSWVQVIGLRQVELDGWTLRINGRRVYARGANWVPADLLPGRLAAADYAALLALVRQANMNMLRVWGGGLREKRPFYELCDRLGILVWQEFPLACAFVTRFPRSPDYLRLVEAEARAIVRDLRPHPSLVLWCGGNEFDPQRNAPLVAALERAVTGEDPTRPFRPASPAGGDSHYWPVWHEFQPPAAYRHDPAAFASEFGLQAPPDVPTLRRFIPPDELWPPGLSWTYHGAGLPKLWRYARPFLAGQAASLEAFVRASQQAQVQGLQIAIEHYRRRKAQGCGGALVWQFNEPWPAISWAILDFYRQPKPAYEMVRRLFQPILVSLDYALRRYRAGDTLAAAVWLVNDRAVALAGCLLEAALWDEEGRLADQLAQSVDLPADWAGEVGRLCWTLPPGQRWRLTCRLSHGGQEVSHNEYDLGPHDDIQPTPSQRLWAWIGHFFMPA